jgi:hypothetical protein
VAFAHGGEGMSALRQRWRLIGLLLLAAVLGTGCNMASFVYLLMGQEPMIEANGMKLAVKDKEMKGIILVYSGVETSPEFAGVERELSGLLTHTLNERFKENKEKVTIISPKTVQEYKNDHPDWYSNLDKVGQHFKVDYVIYLEIESMSLYERGSGNTLYRGRAEIHAKLINMNAPDEDPIRKTYRCEYPRSSGPIPVDDRNRQEFLENFMTFIAKEMSFYFTAHPSEEDYVVERP